MAQIIFCVELNYGTPHGEVFLSSLSPPRSSLQLHLTAIIPGLGPIQENVYAFGLNACLYA
jgi:hypothetical protein